MTLVDKLFLFGVAVGLVASCLYLVLVWRLAKLNVPVKLLSWPWDVRDVFVAYHRAARSHGLSAWPMFVSGVLLAITITLAFVVMIMLADNAPSSLVHPGH